MALYKPMENETRKTDPASDDPKGTQEAPSGNRAAEDLDFLWKTIGRFDFYINSTNTKANFLIAFNTVVLSALVIKWTDIFPKDTSHPHLTALAHVLLCVVALSTIISLIFVFKVINPFLKSPRDQQYQSLVFFGHVAADESQRYLERLKDSTRASVVKDLGTQAHALAQGATTKFEDLKCAIGTIMLGTLPLLVVLLGIKAWIIYMG